MGKGPVGRWGGNFGNFYGGGQSHFMVGGNKSFLSFFSFLHFYGGIPHRKPFKIFMMGGQFKVHDFTLLYCKGLNYLFIILYNSIMNRSSLMKLGLFLFLPQQEQLYEDIIHSIYVYFVQL